MLQTCMAQRLAKLTGYDLGRRPPESPRHRAFIAAQPCVAIGHDCGGDVVCAHMRARVPVPEQRGGKSLRPSDNWTFPACDAHHRLQHQIGERRFEALYGIDLPSICIYYARRSPDPMIREAVPHDD